MKLHAAFLLMALIAGVHSQAVTIRTARGQAAGTSVAVNGIVTVPTGQFGDGGFAIQDFSGGIYVAAPASGSNPSLTLGKGVQVTGVLSTANGLIRITPTAVTELVAAVQPDFACATLTGEVGSSNQGRLIAVNGQVIDTVITERNGKTFTINDSSGNLRVFVPSTTGIDMSAITAGYVLRVIGFSSAYTTAEIVPRIASDLLIVSLPQSASPSPAAPSASPSPSKAPTASTSPSPSRSPVPSASPSPSNSPVASPSPSPSRSPVPSASSSPAPSVPPSAGLGAIYGVEETPGAGTGPTLYVSTTGVDTAAGTISAPLRTLNAAVSKVRPGGTIIMRGGSYQGAVINTGYGNATA